MKFHRAHCKEAILRDEEKCNLQWPKTMPHSMFKSNMNQRNYASWNKMSWTNEDVIVRVLCNHWACSDA